MAGHSTLEGVRRRAGGMPARRFVRVGVRRLEAVGQPRREDDRVEESRAKVVELEGVGETDVMVDGEVMRLRLHRLEVLPGALEVIA